MNFEMFDKKCKTLYFLLLLTSLWLFVSRLLNGYSMNLAMFSYMFYTLTLLNVFCFLLYDNTYVKIRALCYVFIFYVVINFVSIVLFPGGLYSSDIYEGNIWILGYKNQIIRNLLPAVTLIAFYSFAKNGKLGWKFYIFMLIVVLTVLLIGSSTSLVVILFIATLYLIQQNKWIQKYNSLTLSFGVYLAVSIGFVFFEVQYYFSDTIEELFSKDADFSARIIVWRVAVEKFILSPIIGYGFHDSEEWRGMLDLIYSWGSFSHPHNFLLYSLLQGGLVYIMFLIMVFLYIDRRVARNKGTYAALLVFMYIGFFIEGLMESLTAAPLFLPMLGLFTTINENEYKYDEYE